MKTFHHFLKGLTALFLICTLGQVSAQSLLFTADLNGSIFPCSTCPQQAPTGGFLQASPLIQAFQASAQSGGWFDIGNAITGGDLPPDQLSIVIDIYKDLDVKAINLAQGDFRYGITFLHDLLLNSDLPIVSANVIATDSNALIFPGKISIQEGNETRSVIGLMEPPAGLQFLPQVQKQFAGVEVLDPADALQGQLESLSKNSKIGVLYHGSPRGLRNIVSMAKRFPTMDIWIAAPTRAAQNLTELPAHIRLIPVATTGSHLTEIMLSSDEAPTLIPITTKTPTDKNLEQKLRQQNVTFPDTPASSPPSPAPASKRNETSATFSPVQNSNRGIRLDVSNIRFTEKVADIPAAAGKQFALVDLSFENRQAIDLILEKDYPEPLMFGDLSDQLFLKINHGVVVPLVDRKIPLEQGLPQRFTISSSGGRARGQVLFELPQQKIDHAELIYFSAKYPALHLTLFGSATKESLPQPIATAKSKAYLELGVYDFTLSESINDQKAPAGMKWAILELRGKSLMREAMDARAIDDQADLDAKQDVLQPVIYKKAQDLLQLVVDGEFAYTQHPELSELPTTPIFPSDKALGGKAVFLVPADAKSFALYAGFPDFKTLTRSFRPDPMELHIHGPQDLPSHKSLASIPDDPLPIDIMRVENDPEQNQVKVWVTLRNTSKQGGMFEAKHRGNLYLTDGTHLTAIHVQSKGGSTIPDKIWLPANNRPRSFAYVFERPEGVDQATFSYSGVSKAGNLPISLDPDENTSPQNISVDEIKTGSNQSSTGLTVDTDPNNEALKKLGFITAPPPEISSGELGEIQQWTTLSEKSDNDEMIITPPGPGQPLDASLQTDQVAIQLHRMYLLNRYGKDEAYEGKIWLAIEIDFSLLDPEKSPVDINDLEENLPLRLNQSQLITMTRFGGTDPQMPFDFELTQAAPSLRGFVFYEIPVTALGQADLIFFSKDSLPQRMAVIEASPPSTLPAAYDSQANEVLALDLVGISYPTLFQGYHASNKNWLVVELRGKSLLPHATQPRLNTLIWRDWSPRVQLIIDGKIMKSFKRSIFDQEDRFMPNILSGGQWAFDVSADILDTAQSIQLQCGFTPTAIPEQPVITPETIYFTLKGAPHNLPPRPKPWMALPDLNFNLDIIKVSRPERINGKVAPADSEWVQIDIGITSTAEQGIDFKPSDFIEVIDKDRKRIKPARHSWYGPHAPPNSGYESWIPKEGYREFSLIWQVKTVQNPIRLRLNGIRQFRSILLFPEEHPDTNAQIDPDQNKSIAENGIIVHPQGVVPQGIEGVGLTPEQINHAIDTGRDYLWAELQKQIASNGKISSKAENFPAVLALVHCEAHLEYPEFDRALRRYIQEMDVQNLGAYKNSILAMIIEGYGDPTFLPKMEEIAHYFVETQGEAGTWNYSASSPQHFYAEPIIGKDITAPPPVLEVMGGEASNEVELPTAPISRTQSWKFGKNGDHSVTQFAVLGLWSAERSGIPISDDVWKRVLSQMAHLQNIDITKKPFGGYAYTGTGSAYGSMTAAGICILAISMDRLMDDLTPREHLRIRNGLSWLVQNFQVDKNPIKEMYNYYYIYSLERVGQILGIDFIGEYEWYPLGAEYLVKAQTGSGAWPTGKGEGDSMLTSSFALLFLTRATPSLETDLLEEPKGPGQLVTQVRIPDVQHQVYLILDSSGSMRPQINGVPKLDIARAAVEDLASALPQGTQIAVRAYGHSKRAVDPGSELDTELVLPWADANPTQIKTGLAALRAKGRTPLTLSLQQALGDIPRNRKGQTLVVLLTDGGEDDRNADPIAAAAAFAKREDIEFFILGFDINRPEWTQQLTAMAEAGKGIYLPVQQADQLTADLQSIVVPPIPEFKIVDAEGALITQALFGSAPLSLPKGEYKLEALGQAIDFNVDFHIRAEGTTKITLDMTQLPKQPISSPRIAPPAEATPALEKSPTPTKPSFCTSCGTKLTPGTRFCTGCGSPIN